MQKALNKQVDPSSVTTRKLEGGIIETTYHGRISAEMAARVRTDLGLLLREGTGLCWLIDASQATGIAPAPRQDTLGVVELFKNSGGDRIAAVIPSSPVRMVVSALVFATSLPLRMFEEREAALAFLRTKRS